MTSGGQMGPNSEKRMADSDSPSKTVSDRLVFGLNERGHLTPAKCCDVLYNFLG